MLKEKTAPDTEESEEKKELSLDELEQVTGGSIRNVKYTKTVDISEDTRKNI